MNLEKGMRQVGSWLFWKAVRLDERLNAFLGGSRDETLSSRAYRMSEQGSRHWHFFASSVNLLFWWQRDADGRRFHCRRSYKHGVARRAARANESREDNAEWILPKDDT